MTDRPAADDDALPQRRSGAATAEAPELVPAEQVTARLEAAAEFKDKLLRTLAEMENLRKRTEREVADARLYGIADFARDVLAVADNMQRALRRHRRPSCASRAMPKVKALIEGVELTERELLKVLEKHGVQEVLAARREVRSELASGDVRSADVRAAAPATSRRSSRPAT